VVLVGLGLYGVRKRRAGLLVGVAAVASAALLLHVALAFTI
jgi:hypothetical protein